MSSTNESDLSAALWKTVVIIAAFLLVYHFSPNLLSPFKINYAPEISGNRTIHTADTRPQRLAYLVSLTLIVVLTLIPKYWLWFPKSRLYRGAFHTLRLDRLTTLTTKLSTLRAPSLFLLFSLFTLVVVWSGSLRHSLGATHGPHLDGADLDQFTFFAGMGEALVDGKLSGTSTMSPYGLGAAAVYAGLRAAGLQGSYALLYDITWVANAFFMGLWALCSWKIAQRAELRSWTGIIVLFGAAMILPQLLWYKLLMSPTFSAIRYFPFVLLFLLLAWMPARTGIKTFIVAAILAFIGLCCMQDFGVFTFLGFSGAVLLDRRIDWHILPRSAIWLAIFSLVLAVGSFILRSWTGYNLPAAILNSAQIGASDYGGLLLKWKLTQFVIFSISAFVILYVGPRFFSEDVPYIDRISFITAAMLVLSCSYYIRRPMNGYWIFDALFIPISIFLAVKAQADAPRMQQEWRAIFATFLLLVFGAHESVHTLKQLYRDKDALRVQPTAQNESIGYFSGINGPKSWADRAAKSTTALTELESRLSPGVDMLVVTGEPFRAMLHTKPTTSIQPLGYVVNTDEAVLVLARNLKKRSHTIVVIEKPDALAYSQEPPPPQTQRTARWIGESSQRVTAALTKLGYTPIAFSNPYWIILVNNDFGTEKAFLTGEPHLN